MELMLRDALIEMISVYNEMQSEIPLATCLIEQLPVEVNSVCQTA